jgi:hypothetical protein
MSGISMSLLLKILHASGQRRNNACSLQRFFNAEGFDPRSFNAEGFDPRASPIRMRGCIHELDSSAPDAVSWSGFA